MSGEFDLVQIFWGDATFLVLLEIAFRTTVLFIFTLVMLRMVGHRGMGQLSLAEFVIILGLGSAVGDPMFYLDIPLIYGMLVIALVVFYQIILTYLTMRNTTVADLTEGGPIRLVADGVIDLDGIKAARMTHPELLAELRQHGVRELGEVECAYLEIDGNMSLFRLTPDQRRPGLPVLPEYWKSKGQLNCGDQIDTPDHYACKNCGFTHLISTDEEVKECPRCKHKAWVTALHADDN